MSEAPRNHLAPDGPVSDGRTTAAERAASEHKAAAVDALRQAGVSAAWLHAFETTGLLVTDSNRDQFTETELAAFQAVHDQHLAETPS